MPDAFGGPVPLPRDVDRRSSNDSDKNDYRIAHVALRSPSASLVDASVACRAPKGAKQKDPSPDGRQNFAKGPLIDVGTFIGAHLGAVAGVHQRQPDI